MNKIYFTTGPTEMYPCVREFLLSGLKEKLFSISHRGKKFESIYKSAVRNLKKLLGIPSDYLIFFTGSGTECMERIIQNLVWKESFHFVNGSFSRRFLNISKESGKNTRMAVTPYGGGFDFDDTDIPPSSEIICLTHNETSTGVALPLNEIYRFRKSHPDKLIALDAVTSLPFYDFDFNLIDVCFFSVQKGFGIPSGLGVIIINPDCIKKTEFIKKKGVSIGTYNNFIKAREKALINQTTVTPNILGIYLLGKVAGYLLKRGISNIRKETEEKAKLIYDFFDKSDKYKPFVDDISLRSKTTAVLETGNNKAIMNALSKHGFIVSSGYGEYKDSHIRIANFPMHTKNQLKKLISLIL